jgi:NADH:ubiquinone oxidoreductase subunit K
MSDGDFLDERVYDENAAQKGMKWFGRLLAVVVILVIFAFGDVMYIQLMSNKFPAGPLLVLCYIGAFSSFLAIVYMLIGKSVLFSPGRQMVLSWMFLGVELAMVAMNIILVFQGTQDAQGFMAFWLQVAPATPVLNMGIVAILFFLDEDQARRHSDLELQNQIDNYDRKYVRELHKSRTKLKMRQLDYVTKALEQAVNSQESLDYIAQFGADMNVQLLQNLTGKPAPQQQRRVIAPVVEADKDTPKQLPAPAQASQKGSLLERVKRGVQDVVNTPQAQQTPPQTPQQPPVEQPQPEMAPQSYAQTASVASLAQIDRRRQMIEQRRRRRQQAFMRHVGPTAEPTQAPVQQPVEQKVEEQGAEGNGVSQPKNVRRARAKRAKQAENTPTE